MRRAALTTSIIVALTFLGAAPLRAQSLNIDIGTVEVAPANTYGAAASQAGAWSKLGLGTTPGLVGLTGTATAVSATVTAESDTGGSTACSGDVGHLLNDNIYSSGGGTWAVTLTGLAPGSYAVYLYEPANAFVVTGNMTVNGTPVAGVTGKSCTLTLGTNYTTSSVTLTGGPLTIVGDSTGTPDGYAGLAGLQVVFSAPLEPVPASSPAALLLLATLLAGAGLAFLTRRIGA